MRVGNKIHHNLYDDNDHCIGHMHTDADAQNIVDIVAARQRALDTLQQVREAHGPSGMINASQVIGLLSLTWPDGNYSNV